MLSWVKFVILLVTYLSGTDLIPFCPYMSSTLTSWENEGRPPAVLSKSDFQVPQGLSFPEFPGERMCSSVKTCCEVHRRIWNDTGLNRYRVTCYIWDKNIEIFVLSVVENLYEFSNLIPKGEDIRHYETIYFYKKKLINSLSTISKIFIRCSLLVRLHVISASRDFRFI